MVRTCTVCGGPVGGRNISGVCQNHPELQKQVKAERDARYYQEHTQQIIAHVVAYQSARPEQVREWRAGVRARGQVRIVVGRARARAERRGIPFDLTEHDCPPIPAVCPACGGQLDTSQGANRCTRLELDRILSELGYVAGNVQWLCGGCNMLKGTGSMVDLLAVLAQPGCKRCARCRQIKSVEEFSRDQMRAEHAAHPDPEPDEESDRMLTEGWPQPAPFTSCWTCTAAKTVTAFERCGWLVPRPRKAAAPKPRQPSKAALRRQLRDLEAEVARLRERLAQLKD